MRTGAGPEENANCEWWETGCMQGANSWGEDPGFIHCGSKKHIHFFKHSKNVTIMA